MSDVRGVRRMGCRTYGVSDVRGFGRMGCRAYGASDVIFYVRPIPQLLVNYCIINNKNYLFVQRNKINIVSQLVKFCNHPTLVQVKKNHFFGVGRT